MKYRKKPVVVEAFRLGIDYIPDWFMDEVTARTITLHGTSSGFYHANDTNADIETLEGMMHANYGDYIIRGVKGEIYPCNPAIFKLTYEEETLAMTDKTKLALVRMMCETYLEGYTDHELDSEALNLLFDLIYNVAAFQEEEENG